VQNFLNRRADALNALVGVGALGHHASVWENRMRDQLAYVALEGYAAADASAVWFDRSPQTRLAIEGPERAKFLHNLTTNEVKRLAPGHGCEAFVTSPQGKTLGHVTILVEDERILLRTPPAAMDFLGPHFQKYSVFDDVSISDISTRTFEYHVAGPRGREWLSRLGLEIRCETTLDHVVAELAGHAIRAVRESPTGRWGVTLLGAADSAPAVAAALRTTDDSLGGEASDDDTFNVLRIEAGTPVFGHDITAENLPQEIGRDNQAISFVKGCYLGQETVARIDALGHVNKILKGVRIHGESVPARGSALEADGKVVGKLTSAAFSPGLGCPIGLALIRTTHAHEGRELSIEDSGRRLAAFVTETPMRR
jgi:folate-binding protein YgfZ